MKIHAKKEKVAREIPLWDAFAPESPDFKSYFAWTIGEARAAYKRSFGLDRVPVGIKFVKRTESNG